MGVTKSTYDWSSFRWQYCCNPLLSKRFVKIIWIKKKVQWVTFPYRRAFYSVSPVSGEATRELATQASGDLSGVWRRGLSAGLKVCAASNGRSVFTSYWPSLKWLKQILLNWLEIQRNSIKLRDPYFWISYSLYNPGIVLTHLHMRCWLTGRHHLTGKKVFKIPGCIIQWHLVRMCVNVLSSNCRSAGLSIVDTQINTDTANLYKSNTFSSINTTLEFFQE